VTDDARLRFEDVEIGDTAPEFSHVLERVDLVRYAGASGDFNPMHTNEVAAREAGLPSVFGHGMFTMGMLGKAVTDYVGVGNLRSFNVRFTKQTWPGETLVTKVSVRDKREDGDDKLVVLETSVVNQDGEAKVTGEATAALPAGS